MTNLAQDPEIVRLNAEVNRLLERMMSAGHEFMMSQSPEAFKAFRAATNEYITAHRRWFALACPDLDYDAVYGTP